MKIIPVNMNDVWTILEGIDGIEHRRRVDRLNKADPREALVGASLACPG
jgi:hypothetical protein